MQELCSLNGVEQRTITPYNPQANGMIERANAMIKGTLKKLLEGTTHDWPDHVPYVQLCYNARISSATGSTPFSLMFGRSLNAFEAYGKSACRTMSLEIWQQRQQQIAEVIYPAVAQRSKDVRAKAAIAFARRQRLLPDDAFPPGAQVMMRDDTRASKINLRNTERPRLEE